MPSLRTLAILGLAMLMLLAIFLLALLEHIGAMIVKFMTRRRLGRPAGHNVVKSKHGA